MNYLFEIIKDRQDICYRLLMNRMNVFHFAVESGNVYSLIFFYEKLKPLIKSNNILDYSDKDGVTPLHKACIRYNKKMIDLLIQLGCNIDAVDSAGNTAMIYAVKINSPEVVKKLIINGANILIKGTENKTANELASDYHYNTISNILMPKSLFNSIFKCQVSYMPLKNKSKLFWIYILFIGILIFKGIIVLIFSTFNLSNDKQKLMKCPLDSDYCFIDRIIFLLGLISDCISFLLVVFFASFANKFYCKKIKKQKNKTLIVIILIYIIGYTQHK